MADPQTPVSSGSAVQIISVSAEGDAIQLHESALLSALENIPDNMPVSVISVVGSFRTGKSFFLDILIRAFAHIELHGLSSDDVLADGESDWLNQGKLAGVAKDAEGAPAATDEVVEEGGAARWEGGFGWRPGVERCTTGIWLWDHAFQLPIGPGGSKVAVLLMDTQGMWDSHTSQMLTACIFGLSTLLSSLQIYNVLHQPQHDQLQHLAVFSEYGRLAYEGEREGASEPAAAARPGTADPAAGPQQPFQRLLVLIRDASNFCKVESLARAKTFADAIAEKMFTDGTQEDVQAVQSAIRECYQHLHAWPLPRPGDDVVEDDEYDGSMAAVRPAFKRLVEQLVWCMCERWLEPKQIAGHPLNATQLARYIATYVQIFQAREGMPAAKSLLAATADVNNRNAMEQGLAEYDASMANAMADGFVVESELAAAHAAAFEAAMETFAELAKFGPRGEAARVAEQLQAVILTRWERHKAYNEERNPYRHAEIYVLGVAIAVVSYVMSTVLSMTCSSWSSTCDAGSRFFSFMIALTVLGVLAFAVATKNPLVAQGMMFGRMMMKLATTTAKTVGQAAMSEAHARGGNTTAAATGEPAADRAPRLGPGASRLFASGSRRRVAAAEE